MPCGANKKFPQKLTRTKKKRIMKRQRAQNKRRLNEAPKEALKEKTKESVKLKEAGMLSKKKSQNWKKNYKGC